MRKITTTEITLLTDAAAEHGVRLTEADKKASAALIRLGLSLSMPQESGPSRLIATAAGAAALRSLAPQTNETAAKRQADRAPSLGDVDFVGQPPTQSISADINGRGARPSGKLGVLVDLLCKAGGATIGELTAATGWQPHSVRGAIAGILKKKLGLPVLSQKSEAGRIYVIASTVEEAA
jgi:hypothetical protein